jgi:L-threonylcarbamoyladenylate synthase
MLLRAVERPLAAPSANASGRLSPTTAAHVRDELAGRVAMILDGGPCPIGLESTVVSLLAAEPVLLRPGGIAEEDIAAVVGPLGRPAPEGPLASPGMLESHYAPQRALRLEASEVGPEEALLAFGAEPPAGAAATLNLSPGGDLGEAAANLFAFLRALDRPPQRAIAVMPIPDRGLGRAINDRLRRAAASAA